MQQSCTGNTQPLFCFTVAELKIPFSVGWCSWRSVFLAYCDGWIKYMHIEIIKFSSWRPSRIDEMLKCCRLYVKARKYKTVLHLTDRSTQYIAWQYMIHYIATHALLQTAASSCYLSAPEPAEVISRCHPIQENDRFRRRQILFYSICTEPPTYTCIQFCVLLQASLTEGHSRKAMIFTHRIESAYLRCERSADASFTSACRLRLSCVKLA